MLGRNGIGAKAFVTSGNEIIRAGTAVTISLTIETSNINFNDVNMLVSDSMSTSISSSNNSTNLWMTFVPSQAVTLQELVEISFHGTGNAGTLEVSTALSASAVHLLSSIWELLSPRLATWFWLELPAMTF